MPRVLGSARSRKPACLLETLEERALFSVVNVAPSGNWIAAVNKSKPGDTVNFASGNYAVNSITTLPARNYTGSSGATFTGSAQLNVQPGDISGITFNGPLLSFSGSGINFHNNSIIGNTVLFVPASVTNSQISHNNFKPARNIDLDGDPGTSVSVDYNSVDLRGIGGSEEWLHFSGRSNNLSVSHNVILGNTLRWAFELQGGMTNLKVQGNYIHQSAGSGMSIPIGGSASAPFAGAGQNADISGNTVISDKCPAQSCALEIDGDKNIQVHDNYFSGYVVGITNGTGGQNNQGLITRNNVIVYGVFAYGDGDNTPWKTPPRSSSGDKLYHIGDRSAPAAPAQPKL